ncbi:MAG: sigma-70 family RNA polymerase sigma factor [Rikenellaceae bacterium]|jgi:RNA polymerase sigma-70 factor (ECF subfamily)|nr:sigma-70 family RNA polymerase sigma factor [Rikenellaceae bacterium]
MTDPITREFLELIECNQRIIYKVCSFYASADYTIDDLYQETVCAVWRSWSKFRGESAPSTWIYRIAINTCISTVRKQGCRPQLVPLTETAGRAVASGGTPPEELNDLYRLIRGLRSMERAVILLWLEEKSYKEISDITGLTPGNVATLLGRTKEKLKKMSDQ